MCKISHNSSKKDAGLSQESVFALLLFTLSITDFSKTKSRNFEYADDIGILVQNSNINITKATLTNDLDTRNLLLGMEINIQHEKNMVLLL